MRKTGKIRRIGAIALSAVLFGSFAGTAALAEDEVLVEEAPEIAEEDDVTPLDPGEIGVDEDSLDVADLFVDEGSVTVREGADLGEVQTAESEAEAAAEKVRALLESDRLLLPPADADRLMETLDRLTEEPSPTGSDGELVIGRYIEETMKALGYTVSEQSFHEDFLNEDYVDVPGVNIIAERGANSEHRTRQILLICGHYDSKTEADKTDLLANDKSGAAAMLEIARLLSGVESDVDLCFLFFSGEEDGNFGSLRFAERLNEELKERIRAVICLGPLGYVTRYLPAEGSELQNDEPLTALISETELQTEEAEPEVQKVYWERTGEGDARTDWADIGQGNSPDQTQALSDQEQTETQSAPAYLLGTESESGNEPGNLIRAAYLQKEADQALTQEQSMTQEDLQEIWDEGLEQPGTAQTAEEAQQTIRDWTIVAQQGGMRGVFTDAGLTAVSVFQNIPERYRLDESGRILYPQETEGEAPSGAEGEALSGAEEVTQEGALSTAAPGAQTLRGETRIDPDALREVTDLLAEIIGMYMKQS